MLCALGFLFVCCFFFQVNKGVLFLFFLQPPPSYEEVIREKTQEQVLPPSSSSPTRPSSSITIATQTDLASDPPDSQGEQYHSGFFSCGVEIQFFFNTNLIYVQRKGH